MKTKYQQTEIGEIPEDWEVTTLGGTATLNYGKSLPEISRSEGGVPVYGSSGVTGCHNQALVQDEGYIIGRKGTIGTVHYSPKPFYPIDTTYYVTKDDINCDFKYFYYLLKYLNLDKLNFDSAVPGLNRDVAYRQKYATPKSISEQQQIADILSSLDDKIEHNRKINKTLEEIGKAFFKRWFVDFEFPNDDDKPYKSSGGEMVDSGLRKISRGWKVVALGDVLSAVESGQRPKGGVGKYNKGIPSIGAENINGLANYDYSKEKYIPQDFYNKMTRGILKHKDILLYKDGAYIGKKTIYRNEFPHETCCINEHVFILRTKDKLQSYLYFWLDQSRMTQEIINLNSNAAQPGINQEAIKSLKILVPDDDVLNTFDIFIEGVLSKIYENVRENNFLSLIRDSLLPRLMSGKLRVTV